MNIPPIMAIPPANALQIQLPKYHDNGDLVLHIQQLTKVCVTNGKNTYCHKLQYFPNSLGGKFVDSSRRYDATHPQATWAEVQRAFIP
jgi:hypothetical protein